MIKSRYKKKNSLFKYLLLFLIFTLVLSLASMLFSNKGTSSSGGKDNNELRRQPYCEYDWTIRFENAQGGLRIYIPTDNGYINYNIVHSISKGANEDMWRMSLAYACDENLKNSYAITTGAEWDMALMLQGRNDFIGGNAHGDEVYTSLKMYIDGKEVDIIEVKELTSFEEITIRVESIGYDPNDHTTEALKHFKEYIITADGVLLNQRVEWLNDYTLGSSYMAMMPPAKTHTNMFYLDNNPTPRECNGNFGSYSGAKKATVYGSNLKFTMSIPKYPSLTGGNRFLLTDNGGGEYNKMYFVICDGASVKSGDVWETSTFYQITNS